jgi:adenine phosphoribosyltransferase
MDTKYNHPAYSRYPQLKELEESRNKMDIKEAIRTVPNFPKEGIQFRDITSMLETPQAFNKACIDFTNACMQFNATKLVAIESRGFVFASPVARDMELPLILARKPGKLPNPTYQRNYKLEYGEATLHIQQNSNLKPTDKIVIVDDLIATGGTALAIASLICQFWNIPRENILVLAVVDLPDLGGSAIIKKEGFNVETLVEFEGE